MIEARTTIQMHEAIETAHKERAAAFKSLFESWFGLRNLMPMFGAAQHA